jgi:hypothetical protein
MSIRIIENPKDDNSIRLKFCAEFYSIQCIFLADKPEMTDKISLHPCLGLYLNGDDDLCFLPLISVHGTEFDISDSDGAFFVEYLHSFEILFGAARKWIAKKQKKYVRKNK